MGNTLCCVETERHSARASEGCATTNPHPKPRTTGLPAEGLEESALTQRFTSDIGLHSSNPIVLTTRRDSEEDASEGGVRLVGGRRARGISRKGAGGVGAAPPPHQTRSDAAAFRTILSSQQEPLGPPRLFACEDTKPQLEHREGGLQALLRATTEREAAMRQLAREKLPEVHLLGAGDTFMKVSSNTSGGSFINQKHDSAAPHTGGGQVLTLLSSGQDGGAALTPNNRLRCERQDAEAPFSAVECTVEPPSCPNDAGLAKSNPTALSDKDVAVLRSPQYAFAQGNSTTSAGVAAHCFSVHNSLAGSSGDEREHGGGGLRPNESYSSPTTLYAQSSGGVPSTGARPSVSDAFGSRSPMTSRHSTMSSHPGVRDALPGPVGSQNPLGLLFRNTSSWCESAHNGIPSHHMNALV
jgi:hypothetical protein